MVRGGWRKSVNLLALGAGAFVADAFKIDEAPSRRVTISSHMNAAPTTPALANDAQRGSHCVQRMVGRHSWALLINADWRDVPAADLAADLVLTDPPYGDVEWGSGKAWQGKCGTGRLWDGKPEWDVTPTPEDLARMLMLAKLAVLWGGNYYTGLPPQKAWLVWDKCADMTQAQAELAWSNLPTTVRIYRKSPLGVWGNGGRNGEYKQHPTQKPVPLMAWCLDVAKMAKGSTICDPYMGSGSTGVACLRTGRNFIGVEKDATHYATALERMRSECEETLL